MNDTPTTTPLSVEEEKQLREKLAHKQSIEWNDGKPLPLRDRKQVREEIAELEEQLADEMPRLFITLDSERQQRAELERELAEMREAQRWISVEEKLPDNTRTVEIWLRYECEDGEIDYLQHEGFFGNLDSKWHWMTGPVYSKSTRTVTHWREKRRDAPTSTPTASAEGKSEEL